MLLVGPRTGEKREGISMTRTIVVSTVAIALLGSAAMLAQAQQPAQLQPQVASFFIAENPSGAGKPLRVPGTRISVRNSVATSPVSMRGIASAPVPGTTSRVS